MYCCLTIAKIIVKRIKQSALSFHEISHQTLYLHIFLVAIFLIMPFSQSLFFLNKIISLLVASSIIKYLMKILKNYTFESRNTFKSITTIKITIGPYTKTSKFPTSSKNIRLIYKLKLQVKQFILWINSS